MCIRDRGLGFATLNLGFRLAGLFGFRFLGWGLHPCHHLQPVFRFRITNIRLFRKNFKAVGRGGNRCSSSCLVPTDSLGRFLFRFLPCLLLEGGSKQLWLHTRHLFDTRTCGIRSRPFYLHSECNFFISRPFLITMVPGSGPNGFVQHRCRFLRDSAGD